MSETNEPIKSELFFSFFLSQSGKCVVKRKLRLFLPVLVLRGAKMSQREDVFVPLGDADCESDQSESTPAFTDES